MPLHKRESVREGMLDSIFANRDLMAGSRRTTVPGEEMPPAEAFQAISDELLLDGNARQNLATFCQTWEEPEIHQLMDLCIDKNLIDKDEYPQTAEIERRCVHDPGRSVERARRPRKPVGCSAIGSSEACMLGGMAAKWRWRAKRRAAGKSTDNPNMVCGPVQVVWHKFARYWDVEMREIPMSPGRYCMDVEQMLERVDENTIMVVPTFGVTYTGAYEPVLELSQALDKLQEETGLDVDIHVDGASGAFLAPFCAPGHPVGLPRPSREVDQHLGAQVRAGAPRRGLGPVARHRGAARRPHLPRHLPRRGHAGVPDQLLPARRPDRGAVLQLHPPRDGRLPQRAHRLLRHRHSSWPRRSSSSGRSSCCATPTP